MKSFFCFCLFVTSICILHAQAPLNFNYQAVARDPAGNVITGNLNVRFSIREDNSGGSVRYKETHQTSTNAQGIFSLAIGSGAVASGNFASIDWANHRYFVETELKPSGNSDYISMGTTQLVSVPYALYAAQSGTALDAGNGIKIQNNTIINTGDLSSSNELQTLDVNGNQLSISSGNTVTLPTGTTYTPGAGINIIGNTLSANDISPTNEIQTLSINGNQLSLSNGGGSVQLPGGNSSWTTNGGMTYNSPTTNDVGIGTEFNSNAKLNVVSTGGEHAGNFTSPGTGDALRAYCNGTGAGIRASSLNGPGAVISTSAGDAGQFSSTSGTAGKFISSSGTAGYFSSTTGNGLIVESGKVGIGTTSPTKELEVVNGSMHVIGKIQPGYLVPAIDATSYDDGMSIRGYAHDHGIVSWFSGNGNYEAVLLDRGYGGMGSGLNIASSLSNANWNEYISANKDLNFAHNGTLRAWIYDTDGSYHNSSDSRLKKDIKPFTNVLPGLTQLQAYTYHMKDAPDDAPISVGFMAQEVQKQFPQLVEENDGYLSLCYDHFAVLSVQAIKEQQVLIQTLMDKIKNLEEKMERMDNPAKEAGQ